MGVLSELNSERILTPYSPVIYVNRCRITIWKFISGWIGRCILIIKTYKTNLNNFLRLICFWSLNDESFTNKGCEGNCVRSLEIGVSSKFRSCYVKSLSGLRLTFILVSE